MQALTQRHNFLSLFRSLLPGRKCINNKTALMACENGLFCVLSFVRFIS